MRRTKKLQESQDLKYVVNIELSFVFFLNRIVILSIIIIIIYI